MWELCGCGAVVENDVCSDLMRHSNYLVGRIESKNEEIERLKKALKNLADESFRVADGYNFPHLKRAHDAAVEVLDE